MKNKIWAYLIHLSNNMWGDPNSASKYAKYNDVLEADDVIWKQTIDFLPSQGINTVLIDVGDAIQYESHPEISITGAWTKDKLKNELNRMRAMGLTPIPKLNFSAAHDAWLKEYSRMVSTPIYYQVCEDIIKEVAEVFDYPEYMHLGLDEEDYAGQQDWQSVTIRQHDLWWHDAYFLFDICERLGMRPWVWADRCWNHKEEYLAKMPKSVLQSNWAYNRIRYNADGTYASVSYQTYLALEEAGFEQVPTSSCCSFRSNSLETMQLGKAHITQERLLGYMTAPWYRTLPKWRFGLLHDALQFGEAKKEVYPEDKENKMEA